MLTAPDTAIFAIAGCSDQEGAEEARAYIKAHGWGPEDVRIVRREGVICVVTKGRLEI